jgi:NADH:ubiquinone oxidoreductase subunit 6 (subunit J)
LLWAFGPQLRSLAGPIGSALVGVSFVAALSEWGSATLIDGSLEGVRQPLFAWLPQFAFGLQWDRISLVWTLIITGVGFLIHVYSIGYMSGEKAFARFFAYLSFFVFVIALLSSGVKPFATGPDRAPRILIPALAFGAIGLAAVLVAVYATAFAPEAIYGLTGQADVFGSVSDFGNALFQHNLLPFEVTAFVLMVAIIGVVLLAGDDAPVARRPKRNREPIARNGREPIAR